MTQKRIHDYRGPRSSENLNEQLLDLIPFGIHKGFLLSLAGVLSPGVLFSAGGVRIADDAEQDLSPDAGDPALNRIDICVCEYLYEQTVPAPTATFRIIEGTPADPPVAPDVPAHAILIAEAIMYAAETTYHSVTHAPRLLFSHNAELQNDQTWQIIDGGSGAIKAEWTPDDGKYNIYAVQAGSLSDGDTITWGSAVLSLDHDGLASVNALDVAKLNKTGGTITGNLEIDGLLDGPITLDADDIVSFAADDYVQYRRFVNPAQANSWSSGWTNLGYTWESVEDVSGQTLVIPVPAAKDTRLEFVMLGLNNSSGFSLDVDVGFSETTMGVAYPGGVTDFGETSHTISAGTTDVITKMLTQISPDDGTEEPFLFNQYEVLWIRITAVGAGIRFTGATLHFKRRKIVV